jgi:uncharacterized protein YjdB
MKKHLFATVLILGLITLFGCEEGDPTALKESVKAAELNITSITLQPVDGTVTTGYDVQFTATGHRADGSTIDVTNSVTWTSSNTAVATVNSNGLVSTLIGGSVSISASLASASGSTSLTASSAALQSIAVLADTATPNDLTVSACKNLQLKAIGTYEDGVRDAIPITDYVDWSISSGSGAIGAGGLLRTFSDGIISVVATLDIPSPATDISVTQDLNTITVTPATQTLSINATQQFTATGAYNDNSTANITDNASWSSDPVTVVEINNSTSKGLAKGLATGTAIVTVECGMTSGTATVTVAQDVVDTLLFEDVDGREINPLNIAVGATIQVILRAYLSDGTNRDVTEDAQWSIFNNTGNIVSVNNTTGNKGRVTGLAAGTGVIQATYQRRDYLLIVNVTQR